MERVVWGVVGRGRALDEILTENAGERKCYALHTSTSTLSSFSEGKVIFLEGHLV